MLNLIALFCGQRREARSDPPNVSTSAWKVEIRIHLYTAACGKEDTLAIKSIDQLFAQKRGNTEYPPLPNTHKENENKTQNGLLPAGPLWIYFNNSNTDITAPVITVVSSNTLSYARNHSSP